VMTFRDTIADGTAYPDSDLNLAIASDGTVTATSNGPPVPFHAVISKDKTMMIGVSGSNEDGYILTIFQK
jgi:hypothetical protein